MRTIFQYTLPVFAILFLGLLVVHWLYGRPAPVPDVFENTLPLNMALERSVETDRPVLVFASADWCQPCQFMKRRALQDERVASMISERTIPVYFDVTRSHDAEVVRVAEELRVSGLPALILLQHGEELSRVEGDRTAVELLTWLGNIPPM